MKKTNDWFNPKAEEFLEEYKDISLLSLSWSLYWRLATVIFVVAIIIGFLSEL